MKGEMVSTAIAFLQLKTKEGSNGNHSVARRNGFVFFIIKDFNKSNNLLIIDLLEKGE